MSEPVFLRLGEQADDVTTGAAQPYPPDVLSRLVLDAKEIVERYPQSRSALLPLLHLVQSEDGHLTATGIDFCAAQLGLSGAEVTAVATFYSMYRRDRTGDYLVGVCTNTLCAVMGGDVILEALADHLDIAPGDTTADGTITLEHIECNAACDYAPVVMVNWEFFDEQTPQSARSMVDALRVGEQVRPTRGAPLCTFRETARILAGFADPRDGVLDASGPPGDATLSGLRVARQRDMRAPERPSPPSQTAEPGHTGTPAASTTAEKPAPAPEATVPPKSARVETDPSKTDDAREGD